MKTSQPTAQQYIRDSTHATRGVLLEARAACKNALPLQCRRQLRGNVGDQGDHLPPGISRMETARNLQVFLRN